MTTYRRVASACLLTHIPGFGNKTIRKLTEYAGGEEEVLKLTKQEAQALLKPRQLEAFLLWQKRNPEEILEAVQQRGISFVPWFLEDYPYRLLAIPDSPYGLYQCGKVEKMPKSLVAVIGARECSAYGAYMAKHIGTKLAECGIGVVSGLARGIDGISQQAAASQSGYTIGVLGCGVDVCYPASNRSLYEQCKREGLLVSEYVPGAKPEAWHFPPRNRIISGLADAVIVVEAREKSGTFITVDMALEQGKDIFALPGRLTDPLSRGCNRLIGQGAQVFTSLEEMLENLPALAGSGDRERKMVIGERKCRDSLAEEKTQNAEAEEEKLGKLATMVFLACDFYPKSVQEVWEAVKMQENGQSILLKEVSEKLLELELAGKILEKGWGYYYKKA